MDGINQRIENEVTKNGATWVRFVDISQLSRAQNRGFSAAVLIGIVIDAQFIKDVSDNPDYVHTLQDEYALTENKAGEITDILARLIIDNGFRAISQSDGALLNEGTFNFQEKRSALPHKTVAMLSGAGWIGKNNLLITTANGAAQCLGTVLTDAPLLTGLYEPSLTRCGTCRVCAEVCEKKVIKGKTWDKNVFREEIVDVYGCSTCLKCLVHCPWTNKYLRKEISL